MSGYNHFYNKVYRNQNFMVTWYRNSKRLEAWLIFLVSFEKVIVHHKRIGYNLNVMRQSACLVINTIMVDSFAALFNCMPVDRASDFMMTPT